MIQYIAENNSDTDDVIKAENLDSIRSTIAVRGGSWTIYERKYTGNVTVNITEVRPVYTPRGVTDDDVPF